MDWTTRSGCWALAVVALMMTVSIELFGRTIANCNVAPI
jgi:hypothetical protein